MAASSNPHLLASVAALLAVLGCAPEPAETSTGTGGGTEGGSSGDATAAASTTDGGSTTGEATGTTDANPDLPPPATGIQITDVTADQGVRVPVALDGALVGGGERNLPLFQGRRTMIRAFYELDPDFVPRTIYARLVLEQQDGSSQVYEAFADAGEVAACQGQPAWDCRYGSFGGSFNFLVEGEDIRYGTYYRIELFETKPGYEDVVSDKVPVFPTDGGTMILGVEDSYMKMRVVLVPIYHDRGPECPEAPDLLAPWNGEEGAPSRAEFLRDRLWSHNPADEVTVEVRDVVSFGGSAQESGGILSLLQQLRAQDGADPGEYYYGLIRPCDGGPDFAGVALLGGPSKFDASQRVGWGVWYSSLSSTADTFVHEIGHEQGRRHIACSGTEGGPDPSYPDHPEGDTESYGMDLYGPQVRISKPSDHDYMTYCTSTWVSEWGYRLVIPWIEEISSWELEDGDPWDGAVPVLHARIAPDGAREVWIERGFWEPPALAAAGRVVLARNEGVPEVVEGVVLPIPESSDVQLLAPVAPARLAASQGIELQAAGRAAYVPASKVRILPVALAP